MGSLRVNSVLKNLQLCNMDISVISSVVLLFYSPNLNVSFTLSHNISQNFDFCYTLFNSFCYSFSVILIVVSVCTATGAWNWLIDPDTQKVRISEQATQTVTCMQSKADDGVSLYKYSRYKNDCLKFAWTHLLLSVFLEQFFTGSVGWSIWRLYPCGKNNLSNILNTSTWFC